jgi:hypothetical protein
VSGLLLANDDLCAFLSKEEGRTFTDSLCERPGGFRWVIVKPNGSFHTCAAPEERDEILVGHLAIHRMKRKKRSAGGQTEKGTCDYGNVAI